jgi:hypothetical protein
MRNLDNTPVCSPAIVPTITLPTTGNRAIQGSAKSRAIARNALSF